MKNYVETKYLMYFKFKLKRLNLNLNWKLKEILSNIK